MSKKKKNQSVVSVNNDAPVKKHSDWIAKVLSVAAAIALWFYVMDAQTTQYEKTFYGVEVELQELNSEYDLSVISGRNSKIDVTLRGTKATINAITNDQIKATVDLSTVKEAGKRDFKINVTAPSGTSVLNKSVEQVQLYIDKNTTKAVKVTVNKLYTLPAGYELMQETVNPEFIQVSGPADIVNKIDRAKVTAELGSVADKRSPVSSRCTIVLEDENGNVINNPYIKCDKTEVVVTVPIEQTSAAEVSANFEKTHLTYDSEINPKKIYIVGSPEDVNSYSKVLTNPITVEQDGTYVVGLVLNNVKAYEDEARQIPISEVSVTISNVVDPEELQEQEEQEQQPQNDAQDSSKG